MFRISVSTSGLNVLAEDVERAVRLGLVGLASELEREARRESPVRTGRLRRSVRAFLSGNRITLKASAPYARYVHEGTRPHVIRPRRKKALSWPGARHPVRKVMHPGTKANPFLRRALECVDVEGRLDELISEHLRRAR